jgi:Ca-activated chloride channel family protein
VNALLRSWTGSTLVHPWALAGVVVVVLAWWLGRRRRTVRFGPGGFLSGGMPVTARTVLRPVPDALRVLGLLLVVVALARPVQREPVPLQTEGIDILLCLDVSSSMTATDMDARGSRLDVARKAAGRFVKDRRHDRIGLVRFARYADVLCPPTLDHDALGELLRGMQTVEGDGPEDATGIGNAVARAAQLLQEGRGTSRVVVVLTDGEENVATSDRPQEIAPAHAAQLCAALGVKVYAIAAGDVGGVDTGPLRDLARLTGGGYFEAPNAADVDGVYAAIDELETTELPEPRYRIVEAFAPFLLLGLVLLLGGTLLSHTWLRVLP